MKKPTGSTEEKESANKKSTGSNSANKAKVPPKPTEARTRHSKTQKEPVTIDLKADKVKRSSRSPVPSAARSSGLKTASASATASSKTEVKATKSDNSTTAPRSASSMPKLGRDAANQGEQASASAKKEEAVRPVSAVSKSESVKEKFGGGRLVAGIVGGLIALGGAGAAQYVGILGTPGGNDAAPAVEIVSPQQLNATETALQDRIKILEDRLAQVSETQTVPSGLSLEEANALIDEKLAALPSPSSTGGDADEGSDSEARSTFETLTQAGEKLANRFETLQSQLVLTDKAVEDLQSAVSGGAAGEQAGLTALDDRLKQVDATIAGLQQTVSQMEQANSGESQAQQAEMATQIEGLQTALNGVKQDLSNTGDLVSEKLAGFNAAQVAPLGDALAKQAEALTNQGQEMRTQLQAVAQEVQKVSALGLRINELNAVLSGLVEQVTNQSAQLAALDQATQTAQQVDKQAAQAIAAAALKGDMDQGRPFTASLATLRQVAGNPSLLEGLNGYSDKGVPTKAQLYARFDETRDAILEALVPKGEQSLTDRLFSGAQSLVKIRPVGPQEGDTPEAILSRMDDALSKGALVDVASLWKALPEAGQGASAGWHDDLQARLTADQLVDQSVQSFLLSNAG